MGLPTGIQIIAEERASQQKKYADAHDDEHDNSELAHAAMVYADDTVDEYMLMQFWPEDWAEIEWAKPAKVNGVVTAPSQRQARIKDLARAGALIAAEIDRLQRIDSD